MGRADGWGPTLPLAELYLPDLDIFDLIARMFEYCVRVRYGSWGSFQCLRSSVEFINQSYSCLKQIFTWVFTME
jgi:hypothetical protein